MTQFCSWVLLFTVFKRRARLISCVYPLIRKALSKCSSPLVMYVGTKHSFNTRIPEVRICCYELLKKWAVAENILKQDNHRIFFEYTQALEVHKHTKNFNCNRKVIMMSRISIQALNNIKPLRTKVTNSLGELEATTKPLTHSKVHKAKRALVPDTPHTHTHFNEYIDNVKTFSESSA